MIRLLLCVGYFYALQTFIHGYCLEDDFPVVYYDPFAKQNGELNRRSSYFGFSSVMFPRTTHTNPWIQIGAPRAYSNDLNLTEPGVIVRCEILGPCTNIDVDKEPVTDGLKNIIVHNEQVYYTESRNYAWIGMSMDISIIQDAAVVCGHRWTNKPSYPKAIINTDGACYWNRLNSLQFTKLLPLIKEPRDISYGGGLAGMSAHFTSAENELLLGAPGVNKAKGMVLKVKEFEPPKEEPSRRRRRQTEESIPYDYVIISLNNIADENDTYTGYAITSGHFSDKHTLLFASSMPRKEYKGSVIVFTISDKNHQPLNIFAKLDGNQLGEYFGAALASCDVNGDGFDDLIVGSPHYSTKYFDEGRIQVFYGSSSEEFLRTSEHAEILGLKPKAQFGLAVTSLGDIDGDGFGDLAVGAPYDDDGSGCVYIFMGSSKGIRTVAAQKLNGKHININIKGFGISIAKPADIDSNNYEDLLIGAHQSGHAVLYRSKKTVVLHQSLTPLLDNGKIGLDLNYFKINLCFWFTSKYPPASIIINRTIHLDERGELDTELPTSELTIVSNHNACTDIVIKLKNSGSASNEEINLYNPFKISVEQKLVVKKPPKSIVEVSAITDGRDYFDGNWAVDNPYLSVYHKVTDIPFSLGCNHTDVCISSLDLSAVFVNAKDENHYVIGSSRYIKLKTAVTNTGENAYSTQVLVYLPQKVDMKIINSTCDRFQGGVKCLLANPLKQGTTKYIHFELDMIEIDNDNHKLNELIFNVTLLTSSNNTNANSFQVPLYLVREADMELSGTSGQEYYYMNISRDAANFTQIFRLQRFGDSPVKKVQLELDVPVRLTHKGKVIDFVQIYNYNCAPKNFTDPLQAMTMSRYSEKDVVNMDKEYVLNCSLPNVECCTLKLNLGPFNKKTPSRNFQLKMLLNATCLADSLGYRETLRLQTFATLKIIDPLNFEQIGNGSDFVYVSSIFTSESNKYIDWWIILLAILVGIILLVLAIYGLHKMGFFKRSHKLELESMKQQVQCQKEETDTINTLDISFDTNDECAPIHDTRKLSTFKKL